LSSLLEKYFSIQIIGEILPYLLKGALFTIIFSASSEIIGIIIGLVRAMIRTSKVKVLNQFAIVYADLFSE